MTALSINRVSKSFTSTLAVNQLSLKVDKGDFYALLGPNGAGKSTLINMISTLIPQDDGQISIFGKDTITKSFDAKRYLGVVPQEFNFGIFDKVIDIIIHQAGFYGIDARTARPRAEELLHRLNLWEKRHNQARTLSGGMKRRLMIARALIHKPQIVLLDEPTAGVDIEIRRQIWDFLKSINRDGVTIILTTHYLEEVEKLCNNVAIMNKGSILRQGSVHELVSSIEEQTFLCEIEGRIEPESWREWNFIDLVVQDHALEVTLKKPQTLSDVFSYLHSQGVVMTNIQPKNNRIEDLFLKVTSNSNPNSPLT